MAQQKAGWYPDPNDDKAEVYWDGGRWHGRREKLDAPGPLPGPAPGPVQSGQSRDLRQLWRELNAFGRSLVVGAVLLVVVITGAVILVGTHPWESQREKECKAMAEHEGYRGSQFDSVVKFCVDTQ
jgi:hypothetical protein